MTGIAADSLSVLLLAILAGAGYAVLGLAYKLAGDGGCRPRPFAVLFLGVAALLRAPLSGWLTG